MHRFQPPRGRSAAAFLLACLTIAFPGSGQVQSEPADQGSGRAVQPPPENAPDCPLALELTIIDGQVPREWEEPSELRDAAAHSIRLGEPVCLRLRFTNRGKTPLMIYRPDTARGSVGIRLIGPDGKAHRYVRPRVGRSAPPLDGITIEPGGEAYLETVLFGTQGALGQNRYAFDQPGLWTIDAIHSRGISAPVNVRSKPVLLTVGHPLERWQELWDAGLSGLIDNTEPSYARREEIRAKARAILGPGPTCFDLWLATPPRPFEAIVTAPDDASPEGQARRLAGAYLRALDESRIDDFPPLIADDATFNRSRDKAALLQELRANVGAMDPGRLFIVVEKSEFKALDATHAIARLQVLAHDEQTGRAARSFYNLGFEPRAGEWKIVYLEIQRAGR